MSQAKEKSVHYTLFLSINAKIGTIWISVSFTVVKKQGNGNQNSWGLFPELLWNLSSLLPSFIKFSVSAHIICSGCPLYKIIWFMIYKVLISPERISKLLLQKQSSPLYSKHNTKPFVCDLGPIHASTWIFLNWGVGSFLNSHFWPSNHHIYLTPTPMCCVA